MSNIAGALKTDLERFTESTPREKYVRAGDNKSIEIIAGDNLRVLNFDKNGNRVYPDNGPRKSLLKRFMIWFKQTF